MPVDMPARGPLTDLLVDHLDDHVMLTERGIVFGDSSTPPAAGWTGLQPGQGAFVASVVLTTGEALPLANETLRSRHTTWRCVYGLRSVGATRTQADHAADRARAATLAFPKAAYTLGSRGWTVQDIVFGRMAPVTKQDPTDAPTYTLDDTFEVWIARTQR